MSELHLDYLALSCRDPDALEATLTGPLGLERRDVAIAGAPANTTVSGVALGNVTLLLFEAGDESLGGATRVGVNHLGFACDNPDSFAADIRLYAADDIGHGISGEQFMLDPQLCGGVRTRIGLPLPHFAAGYSDTVERIDHIGIASTDNRRAEGLYANRLGFEVESRQTDMETRAVIESFTSDRYGVVHHARTPEAVGGLRVSFITVGDCELEFLEEFDAQAMSESRALELGRTPGTTQQDQGAIGRFVERQGAGLHHLAIKTPDINNALAKLQAAGVRTIDNTGRPGSRRAQIGFIHPSATGGILIHFVQREPL
jgi:methylmalonyl-CoA/ethylmalonyl-CoA epimerase